jgi:hypothetical protein
MIEKQTIAWIFYAIALASKNAPASVKDIQMAADAINHAVPSEAELGLSFRWLKDTGWIEKKGGFYGLTEIGQTILESNSSKQKPLFSVWESLTAEVEAATELKN